MDNKHTVEIEIKTKEKLILIILILSCIIWVLTFISTIIKN